MTNTMTGILSESDIESLERWDFQYQMNLMDRELELIKAQAYTSEAIDKVRDAGAVRLSDAQENVVREVHSVDDVKCMHGVPLSWHCEQCRDYFEKKGDENGYKNDNSL